MKLKTKITRGVVYQLSRLGQWLGACLSLSTGAKLGKYVASAAFYLLRKERQKALRSLQRIITPEEYHG